MTSDTSNVRLIGFENDAGTGDLFVQFGLYQDYRVMLPEHLLGILRQQHPSVVIESIELLVTPKCNLGGTKQEQSNTLIKVQTLDVPLDLCITIRVGHAHLALDVQLVIRCEGLDSKPSVRSDMFIKAQREVE